MKKIIPMALAVLLVATLFACTQNTGAPVQDSGVNESSSVEEQQSAAPGQPSEAPSSETPQAPVDPAEQPEDDDKIKADKESVLLQAPSEVRFGETATATLLNNSDQEITFGAAYSFQYYVNGAWAALNYREGKERAWIAIAYILHPGGERTFDFVLNADDYTIPLGPGEYRLVKSISADNGGEGASFEVTATFTVK